MADNSQTKQRYIEAIGRRKTAVARVRLHPATGTSFTINDLDIAEYFPTYDQRSIITKPLEDAALEQDFHITVRTYGGGKHAQSEAVRLGIARALVEHDPQLRTTLKKAGYLKRDPRMTERKKFGLRKARRRPQWSKR